MDLNRFKDFYEQVGFWQFWFGILLLALVAYSLFIFFLDYVGPYVVGLWLAGMV